MGYRNTKVGLNIVCRVYKQKQCLSCQTALKQDKFNTVTKGSLQEGLYGSVSLQRICQLFRPVDGGHHAEVQVQLSE